MNIVITQADLRIENKEKETQVNYIIILPICLIIISYATIYFWMNIN